MPDRRAAEPGCADRRGLRGSRRRTLRSWRSAPDTGPRGPSSMSRRGPAFLLVLTHGAGGGVDTPDLLAVRDAAAGLGGAVARVTQPYRLRGARAPGSADPAGRRLAGDHRGAPGAVSRGFRWSRAAGATARGWPAVPPAAAGARAVRGAGLPAAPARPPGPLPRGGIARRPAPTVLVVNGDRDPFGVPGSAGRQQGRRPAGRDACAVAESGRVGRRGAVVAARDPGSE